jgi:uncharacterized iron-regulated membrane protein
MKPWMLKLHRWVALVFALPLVFVIGTGLLLSFEPWLVVRAIEPGSLTNARVQELLARHDPQGQARSLVFRSYDKTLTISGGRRGGTVVDTGTGQALAGPSGLANALVSMRRMHESLIFDLGWLVIASSYAMLVLAMLGVLMGWPRLRNTPAGWHKAMAWGLLPLIVLSPLTGLFLAYGITFSSPPAGGSGARGAPLPLKEAVRIVGEKHDLSSLVWLRQQGGRQLVRLVEGGEYRVYAVTPNGIGATPRNWPRLWHEGNFAGAWSALMNVVISVAMAGLLVTGLWIWLRRQVRRRVRVRQPA